MEENVIPGGIQHFFGHIFWMSGRVTVMEWYEPMSFGKIEHTDILCFYAEYRWISNELQFYSNVFLHIR